MTQGDTKRVFRKQYLIDKDFQLKYAFLLSCVAIIVSVLIGGLVFYSVKESHMILIKSGLADRPEVISLITHWKNFLTYNLVMLLCGTIAFLTIFGIFLTHKMVGPIFVLKRRLKEIEAGRYDTPMRLRKGDEFQDVKDHFNQMLTALQKQTREDIDHLHSMLDKITDIQVRERMTHMIQKKKQTLGGI